MSPFLQTDLLAHSAADDSLRALAKSFGEFRDTSGKFQGRFRNGPRSTFMSHPQNRIYEFGPYRLDVAERLLLRNGETIPLQPKAFDLLFVLVEHQGHLLEKDVLLK